jgi:hypothetical protein
MAEEAEDEFNVGNFVNGDFVLDRLDATHETKSPVANANDAAATAAFGPMISCDSTVGSTGNA